MKSPDDRPAQCVSVAYDPDRDGEPPPYEDWLVTAQTY